MSSTELEAAPARAKAESWGSHLRATLALGLPLVGAQLAQTAINVTDTVMMGWLGARELAAGLLATQLFFLVWMFGSGFAHAVMPLAADAEGRGDPRGVRRSVRMGIWLLSAYALLVQIPLWHTETILVWLRQEPETAALAGAYMRVLQWGMLPALLLMVLRSYLAVLSRAHVVLWATAAGALLNGVLDYALIFGRFGAPAFGVVGAAAASLGTHVAIFLMLLAYTLTRPALRKYELYARFWRPDWPALGEVLRLGWPIGASIVAEVGLFYAASIMMGWLGTIALAAHGIALQLASTAFMIPLGLSNAATIRVGLAYGRGDRIGLARGATVVLAVAAVIALLCASLFWTLPAWLIGLYLDPGNPNAGEVLLFAVPLLGIAAAFQIVDALQVIGAGLLRGLKDTRTPMLLAVTGYWLIGLPAAYLLCFVAHWGASGIWWGLAISLAIAAVVLNWRFHRREALGLMTR
ncbi:MATE family efflux transporter [Mangrovibrevibacter kandeliae]|uniref:MATE family efflux transporter n=1 Tax=Mangrovibrevibacter kandeliae TaxID=2968473 RepID=UPI0021193000|nr:MULTISPECIES: MATE family efflux transporter [unclassified Aurantimonas]MCQ8782375.1 MATE family efflux transporter [Aurantimonas sp. CSK15Z-1]MCW4114978.1 MATE family efflux transporter [Aurantimonas sp. MSK8Z-1]